MLKNLKTLLAARGLLEPFSGSRAKNDPTRLRQTIKFGHVVENFHMGMGFELSEWSPS